MPAKPQPFSLVNQTYETRDGLWSKSRTINFYPCIDTSGTAQSKVELAPCPGIAAFSSVANPLRGLWVGDNRLFAVGAGTVYEISSSGAATAVGDPILNAQTPVQFASDGNALAVASGNEIWVLATPDGGGPIGSTMVHAGISIVYLDSYWIILLPDSNVSKLNVNEPAYVSENSRPRSRRVSAPLAKMQLVASDSSGSSTAPMSHVDWVSNGRGSPR